MISAVVFTSLIILILVAVVRSTPKPDPAFEAMRQQLEADATPGEPRCGRCRYIVRGISSLTCPECGSDLREVGIDLGYGRRPGWGLAVVLAVLWGGMVLKASEWALGTIDSTVPRVVNGAYEVSLQLPASGAYQQLLIEGTGDDFPAGGAIGEASEATLTLIGNAGTLGTLTVDLAADRYHGTIAGSAMTDAHQAFFGQATVLDWMTRCTGSTDPGLRAEAAGVARLLRAAIDQQRAALTPRSTFSSGGSSSSPWGESGTWSTGSPEDPFGSAAGSYSVSFEVPIWYRIVTAIAALLIWLMGVGWLFRRYGPPRRAARRSE